MSSLKCLVSQCKETISNSKQKLSVLKAEYSRLSSELEVLSQIDHYITDKNQHSLCQDLFRDFFYSENQCFGPSAWEAIVCMRNNTLDKIKRTEKSIEAHVSLLHRLEFLSEKDQSSLTGQTGGVS